MLTQKTVQDLYQAKKVQTDVPHIHPDTTLAEAVHIMREYETEYAVLLDPDGDQVDILSYRDAMEAYIQELEENNQILAGHATSGA